jgi:pyruvate/2-oxoglutarate dehydrogenase complex dihydrolipoamide acyltransferase (E2) component
MTTAEPALSPAIARRMHGVVPVNMQLDAPWPPIQAARESSRKAGHDDSPSLMFAWCAAQAMRKHPAFRSGMREDGKVVVSEDFNLGIAVALNDGEQAAAVISGANHLDWRGFSSAYTHAVAAARAGSAEAAPASLILTCLGSTGIEVATPIVVPPAVGNLVIGRAHVRMVASEGIIAPVEVVTMCLTFDHRVVNGAGAAGFLHDVKLGIAAFVLPV